MPTYEYQPAQPGEGCDSCKKGLEVLQRMAEAALERCPDCGVAIVRVITAPGVNTRPSDKSTGSDKNLKRLGFKKFVREEGGYRQTV